jgi:hypothetical protein
MSAVSHPGNKVHVLKVNIVQASLSCFWNIASLQPRNMPVTHFKHVHVDDSKELARLRVHEYGRFGE